MKKNTKLRKNKKTKKAIKNRREDRKNTRINEETEKKPDRLQTSENIRKIIKPAKNKLSKQKAGETQKIEKQRVDNIIQPEITQKSKLNEYLPKKKIKRKARRGTRLQKKTEIYIYRQININFNLSKNRYKREEETKTHMTKLPNEHEREKKLLAEIFKNNERLSKERKKSNIFERINERL